MLLNSNSPAAHCSLDNICLSSVGINLTQALEIRALFCIIELLRAVILPQSLAVGFLDRRLKPVVMLIPAHSLLQRDF